MKKAAVWFSSAILAGVVACLIGFSVLLTTETGSRWVLSRLDNGLGETFDTGTLHGRLLGPFHIDDLKIRFAFAEAHITKLSLNWRPLDLIRWKAHVTRLEIERIHIIQKKTKKGPSNKNNGGTPFQPPKIPLELQFDQVKIGEVQFTFLNDSTLLVNPLILQGSLKKTGRIIASIFASGDWGEIKLNGQAGLKPDSAIDIKTDWTLNNLPFSQSAQGSGSLKGRLSKIQFDHEIRTPLQAKMKGVIENVTSAPRWRAEIEWEQTNLRDFKSDLRALSFKGQLRGFGDTASLNCDIKTRITDTRYGTWDARIQARGWKDGWELSNFAITSPTQTVKIHGEAFIKLGENREPDIDLKAEWENLNLNLLSQELNGFSSPGGTISIKGSLQKYRLVLEPVLNFKSLPPSRWSLKAEGDKKAFRHVVLQGNWMGGTWSSEGELTFSPHLSWAADIKAEGVNPGLWRKEWTGNLGASLHLSGSREKNKLSASIDLQRLDGTLRGLPFKAETSIRVNEGRYEVANFDLWSGAAHLTGSGRFENELNVIWSLTAERIQELLPGIKGAVNARGKVTGSLEHPRIQAEARAEHVSRENFQLEFLEARIDAGTEESQPIQIKARAVNFRINQQYFKNALITGEGLAREHVITVDINKTDREHIRFNGRGYFSDNQYKVSLDKGTLVEKQYGNWTMDKPGSILLSTKKILLDQFCWSQSESRARACASLSWQKDGIFDISFGVDKFALKTLGSLMTYKEATATGMVDGRGVFSMKNGTLVKAEASFQAIEGEFIFPLSDEEKYRIPYRRILLELKNTSDGFLADLSVDLADSGRAKGSLLLPGWQPGSDLASSQPITGRMELVITDLNLINQIVPDVDSIKGSIHSNLTISGTRSAPRVSGKIKLTEGSFSIPRLGVKITEIQIAAENKDNETMNITGTAHSDPGSLEFSGLVHYSDFDAISAKLFIKGHEFGIADLPEIKVAVSPDMNIEIKPYQVFVRGSVVIPEADIRPIDLERVTKSSLDVVIVGAKEEEPSKSLWKIHNEVKIELGENVKVEAYNLKGRVIGQLAVQEDKNGVLIGQGELSIVEGSYLVYGQELVIERGRLLFFSSPIENPGIDFRATREVQDVLAGVIATGNLSNPEISLFSSPAMDDVNTLSYLLLGRPFNPTNGEQDQQLRQAALGIGLAGGGMLASKLTQKIGIDEIGFETGATLEDTAMVLGTYLTPKIYIRYVSSLWRSVYNFTIRYQFRKNWAIETQTGEQKGADIIFSTER